MGFDEEVQKPKDTKGCFPLILMTLGLAPSFPIVKKFAALKPQISCPGVNN
jgi:hypothetical protein